MKAIEILADEHRAIERLLGYLERFLQLTAFTDSLDAELASGILEFLETVADGAHQDKEERVLLPCILRHVDGEEGAFVLRLSAEHENERRVLSQLRGQLEGAAYGDSFSRDSFVLLARSYLGEMSQHAAWEDAVLLPFAERVLEEREDAALLAAFREVEGRYFDGRRPGASRMLDRIQHRLDEIEPATRLSSAGA